MVAETKTEFINNLMTLLEKYDVSIYATIGNYNCDKKRREQLLVLVDNKTELLFLVSVRNMDVALIKKIYKNENN